MTNLEARKALCEALSDAMDGDFPCICGFNPISPEDGDLTEREEKVIHRAVEAITVLCGR